MQRMKKLKLSDLEVTAFTTQKEPTAKTGTVFGAEPTPGATCWDTQCCSELCIWPSAFTQNIICCS